MKKFTGFEHGMGMGGWLTNYKRLGVLPEKWRLTITEGDLEHFDSYITEKDIEYIASLGMDHIRLGFDQIVMEEEPFKYRERTFLCIDRFIEWCGKYGLGIVLNMHKAVGNYCDVKEDKELLDDEELQERFIAMWVYFEKRYHGKPDVIFELLNEVRNVSPDKWNDLAEKTIKAIRELNPTRRIIVGSTCWNSPDTLSELRLYDDENVIYTFHFYEPFEFTHQRGVLQPPCAYYNREMPYPGDIERYRDFRRFVNGEENPYPDYTAVNRDMLHRKLKAALDFADAHPDKILWFGEFGTIRHANIKYREAWMRDVISIVKEKDIPFCVWNYLSTPYDGNRFSLVDDDNRRIVSEEMAKIIRGEV